MDDRLKITLIGVAVAAVVLGIWWAFFRNKPKGNWEKAFERGRNAPPEDPMGELRRRRGLIVSDRREPEYRHPKDRVVARPKGAQQPDPLMAARAKVPDATDWDWRNSPAAQAPITDDDDDLEPIFPGKLPRAGRAWYGNGAPDDFDEKRGFAEPASRDNQ